MAIPNLKFVTFAELAATSVKTFTAVPTYNTELTFERIGVGFILTRRNGNPLLIGAVIAGILCDF